MKKVYLGLFCIFFVALSIFEINNMFNYYNLRSYVYGSPVEYKNIFTSSVQSVCFENNGETNEFIISSSSDEDLTSYDINDLEIQINNLPVNTTAETSNMITGEFTIYFYNADKENVYTDTLYVSVSLFENSTSVILKTVNGETAVSYWQEYIQKHGIFVNIIERERTVTETPQDIDYIYYNANSNVQVIKVENNTINMKIVADVASIGAIGEFYRTQPFGKYMTEATVYINDQLFMQDYIHPSTTFNANDRNYYVDDYVFVYSGNNFSTNKFSTNLLNASQVDGYFYAINTLSSSGELKLSGVNKTLKVNVTFELANMYKETV